MKQCSILRQLGTIMICLALAGSSLCAAVPAVLQKMPADAGLIIATQPLETLNAKASALAKKLNLPIPPDQPLDLGSLLGMWVGIPGQMDTTKGIGISIGNMMQSQQTMVIYLPMLNVGNTLVASGGVKNEAAPGIWTLPNQKGFAKSTGGYLMIASQSLTLTNLASSPKGVKLSESDQALFAKSDIAVTANMAPIMGMAKMMAAGIFMNNPKVQQYPSLMQLVNLLTDRLAEIERTSLGLSLGQSGINLAFHLQARPASQLAGYFTGHPTTDISELAVLPPAGYSTIYAFNYNGEAFRPFFDSLFDILGSDPTISEKIGAESITTLKTLMSYKMDAKGAVAEYATASGTKKSLGVTSNSDLDKMLEAGQKACPLITKIIAQFGFDIPITYQVKAGTTGGLIYDQVTVDFSKFSTDPKALEVVKKQMGGSLSFTEKFCKIDEKRLAFTLGDGNLEELLNFIKSGQPGLDTDPAILNTAKGLPDKANVYAFIHVGNAVRSMLATAPPQIMMMAGMLTQIQGVIGTSAVMGKGSLKTDLHIPDDVIQSIGTLIQQFMMMQQQQAQPLATTQPSGS
jgi:hypothetical protein